MIFGFLFWAVMDELMVPLLRLAPDPLAFPWQTHFRGLVEHLVVGVAAEATLALASLVLRA